MGFRHSPSECKKTPNEFGATLLYAEYFGELRHFEKAFELHWWIDEAKIRACVFCSLAGCEEHPEAGAIDEANASGIYVDHRESHCRIANGLPERLRKLHRIFPTDQIAVEDDIER
jgi:hypothetical protein